MNALRYRVTAGVRKRRQRVNFRRRWRTWSGGRVAEGTGLLNRHRGSTPIEGSNPSRSVLQGLGVGGWGLGRVWKVPLTPPQPPTPNPQSLPNAQPPPRPLPPPPDRLPPPR